MASARAAPGGIRPWVADVFLGIEERRLGPILSGEHIAGCDSGGDVTPALRRRHWLGVVMRLVGLGLGLVLAFLLPVILTALTIAAAHGVAVIALRGARRTAGMTVAGIEVAGFLGVFHFGGAVVLWLAVVVFLVLMAVLVVWSWRVDMELVTTGKRLIRTRGVWLMRREAFVPLDSIRASSVAGPYFRGLGRVTFDSASDEDRLLHGFGLMSNPDQWAAQVMALRRMDSSDSG